MEGDGQVRWQGIVVHDYVPSDYLRPKRTEPDCDHCGEVRRSPVHGGPDIRFILDGSPGARPGHWWVSETEISVLSIQPYRKASFTRDIGA
jgi:hypothetical protein